MNMNLEAYVFLRSRLTAEDYEEITRCVFEIVGTDDEGKFTTTKEVGGDELAELCNVIPSVMGRRWGEFLEEYSRTCQAFDNQDHYYDTKPM